jgi:hypothetical protein
VNSALVSLDFPEGTSAKAVWRLLIPPQTEMGTLDSDDLVVRLRYTAKAVASGDVGWEVAAYLLDIGDPAGDVTGATVTGSNNSSNLTYSGAAYDEQENTVTIAGFFTDIDTSKAYTLILKITRRTVFGDLAGEVSLLPSYAVIETSSGPTYTRPSWPAIEADEEYRAELGNVSTPFNDASGNANHASTVGTLRYVPSFFYEKMGAYVSGGSWRLHGVASIRRNTAWTVDCVVESPETNGAQYAFLLANTGSGNIKGGFLFTGTGAIQVWIPAGWQTICSINNYYYGQPMPRTMAITVQWGTDEIVRCWINGFLFYESAVLTPPAVVGDEGIIATASPNLMFFRYRSSAPATPYSWQSAALYGV